MFYIIFAHFTSNLQEIRIVAPKFEKMSASRCWSLGFFLMCAGCPCNYKQDCFWLRFTLQ